MAEVFRVEKNGNYTVMSNFHLRERGMSLKAMGLMCYMLSNPDDWDYTLRGLARACRDGIDSVRSALRELEKFGFVERGGRERDEKGQLHASVFIIHEEPVPPGNPDDYINCANDQSGVNDGNGNGFQDSPALENPIQEKPAQENPALEKPAQENPTQLNTNNIPNTIIYNNTNILNQGAPEAQPEKNPEGKKDNDSRMYFPGNRELSEAFRDFVYMRKRIGRPLTPAAVAQFKKSVVEMASGPDGRLNTKKAVAILNNSTKHCYPGLYPVRPSQAKPAESPTYAGLTESELEEIIAPAT